MPIRIYGMARERLLGTPRFGEQPGRRTPVYAVQRTGRSLKRAMDVVTGAVRTVQAMVVPSRRTL